MGHKRDLYKLLKTKQKVRRFMRFEIKRRKKYENRIKNKKKKLVETSASNEVDILHQNLCKKISAREICCCWRGGGKGLHRRPTVERKNLSTRFKVHEQLPIESSRVVYCKRRIFVFFEERYERFVDTYDISCRIFTFRATDNDCRVNLINTYSTAISSLQIPD